MGYQLLYCKYGIWSISFGFTRKMPSMQEWVISQPILTPSNPKRPSSSQCSLKLSLSSLCGHTSSVSFLHTWMLAMDQKKKRVLLNQKKPLLLKSQRWKLKRRSLLKIPRRRLIEECELDKLSSLHNEQANLLNLPNTADYLKMLPYMV